jgi:hypothetical protein
MWLQPVIPDVAAGLDQLIADAQCQKFDTSSGGLIGLAAHS